MNAAWNLTLAHRSVLTPLARTPAAVQMGMSCPQTNLSVKVCPANTSSYYHQTLRKLAQLLPVWLLFTVLDINECASGSFTCHTTQICLNNIGSYDCVCSPGQAFVEGKCQGMSVKLKSSYYHR